MYHKPPIRTYQRKKGGASHWHLSSTSGITREDIPLDRDLQPPEFKAFKNSDTILEYDPFDTTFDRLARNAIVHPISPDQASNSSYLDSSSDEIRDKNVSSDNDSLFSEPFENPEPVPKTTIVRKRRNNKKQKLDEQNTVFITKTLTRETKQWRKIETTNKSIDENTEPNVELSDIENTRGKKKSARTKVLQMKHPAVDKTKTTIQAKSKKRKNPDDSRVLKRCAVSLKRLSLSLGKSGTSTNKEIDEIKRLRSDSSIAEISTQVVKPSETPLNNDLSVDSIIPVAKSIVVDSREIDQKSTTQCLKNPFVTLSKLNITQRLGVRDFSSSTPLVSKVTKRKSSIVPLSPISNDVPKENEVNNDLELASLAPKSFAQMIDSVSTNSINSSLTLSETKKKKSSKRPLAILSVTPDSELSGMMFDDTEIVDKKSDSPKFGSHNEVTDTSTNSPLLGFGRESSDHESLHLTYDDNDETEELPSKNLGNNVESLEFPSGTSSISNEKHIHTIDTSMKDPFLCLSKVQVEFSKDESTSVKTRKFETDDEWSTISGSLDATDGKSFSQKRGSVEQLSSGEFTSSDEIAEFVRASEMSNSQVELDDKEFLVGADGSSNVITDDGSIKKAIEKSSEKYLLQDNHRALQPIVVLSRLNVPNSKSEKIDITKNSEKIYFSDILESTSQLSIDDDTTSNFHAEQSMSMNELSSMHMELESSKDTEESKIAMDSLKIDEISDSLTEVEKSSIIKSPESDLNKYNGESSIENLSYTSDVSSMSVDLEIIETLPKKVDISKSPELNVKPAEKSEILKNNISYENDVLGPIQPIVLLTRLNDPFRITKRRNIYRNWDLKLSAISENNVEKVTTSVEEDTVMEKMTTGNIESNPNDIAEISKEPNIKLSDESSRVSTQSRISQQTTDTCGSSFMANEHDESTTDKVVYLKPGKSWARSLSILSQVHNKNDLESLAVGKGKKWRESVLNLLDMQQHGLLQSCVKQNENDKESRSLSGLRNSTAWVPGSSQPDTGRLFGLSSPGRFIRRVSIRVVPDCKNFDHVKDTSFLEAYGINPSEDRETITRRQTSIVLPRTLEPIPHSISNVKSRDVVLAQCRQKSSLPFEECYPESYLENCRKIGEGVYGEVFLYEADSTKSVIKIIPIEGDMKINSERQKKFDEILSEIVIAKELHNLRFTEESNTSSFVEVKNIRCVMGKYPGALINLWKTFDEEKNSENDCPSIFEENQLYIVLELGHGGEDLEAFVFQNATEAHALFMQTALALAVAEESLEFEHRDLHWGNLLISRTDDSQIDFKLRGKPISVTSKGVKVSVIDFTLSRMSYQGCSIFNDLSMDDDLFVAQGEYQFDIYRLMRQKLENKWQKFEPFTNILWLHYILDKMITAVRYRRKMTKVHKNGIVKLQELKNEILEYDSAVDFVLNCDKATRLRGSRSSVSTIAASKNS